MWKPTEWVANNYRYRSTCVLRKVSHLIASHQANVSKCRLCFMSLLRAQLAVYTYLRNIVEHWEVFSTVSYHYTYPWELRQCPYKLSLCDNIDKISPGFMLKGKILVWSDKLYKSIFLDFCCFFAESLNFFCLVH